MVDSERQEIYDRYKKGESVRGIAKDYPYSLTFIQQLIKSFNYDEDIARNYPKVDGMDMYAICKKTGKEFYDYKNNSGCITKYICDLFPDEKSNSTYKRKAIEQSTGRFWYDDYFTFEYKSMEIERTLKTCFYCNWNTEDIENKSGIYTKHLKDVHNKSVKDYLLDNVEDKDIFPSFYSEEEKEIECKICGEKFHMINDKHLAKHNINMDDYKMKYGRNDIVSSKTSAKLLKSWEENLKHKSFKRSSSYEKNIVDLIPEINFQIGNRSILNGFEIDLYSENHKIGIEVNGVYYHSEISGKKNRLYHLNKTIKAKEVGVKLIQIFEDELVYNHDLIIDKIKHIFNVSNLEKIHARKCKIKESKIGVGDFLDKNHIQGSVKSNINICAYHNDELIAVMSFNNQRQYNKEKKHTNKTYELVRFAVKSGVTISGIASRLLKYFILNNDVNRIVSFADMRWTISEDNLYIKLGFKLIETLKPDYKYINFKSDKTKRLHKFGFGKNIIAKKYPEIYNKNKTEWEMMQELGYDRIWDCGKFKYEMII